MILIRLMCFLACLPLASAAEPLRSFAAVRALTHEAAAMALPVEVEAAVLGADPASALSLFLHDGTAGCYVKLRPEAEPMHLTPGTRVRVVGVSMALGYYPSVERARVEVVGPGSLPAPLRLEADRIFAPELDSAWVVVPAMMVGYEAKDERVTLDLEVYGLPFKAELPLEERAEEQAAELMQRPVLLRGVLGTIFNRQRQMTDRHFFVSSFAAIEPVLLPAEGAEAPLIRISQMLTAGFGPHTHIQVEGVVTQAAAKGFYLRDETGSTLVIAARGRRFPPGTRVRVDGFASVAPYRPVLRAASVVERENTPPPRPVPFVYKRADLPKTQAELVTLEARFLARQEGRSEVILECQTDQQIFEVLLPLRGGALPRLTVGDRLRLVGICELTTTHALPRIGWVDGFRLHLSGPEGAEVIAKAPWWTPRRLLVALGVMSAVAFVGLAGTWVLRRRVRRQMEIIGDSLRAEAVGKERDRIARDLHDTLEQQLSGVALQLDGLDDVVKGNPAAASKVLLVARRMLRYTRLEARRSVWDLRSKILEEQGLLAALRDMVESSAGPAGPKLEVQVVGGERSHPAGLEFHLFRIAQEALANAIKHGEARTIVIRLENTPGCFRLSVCDDGRGFDPQAKLGAPGPHFGLLGMRERAAKAGVELNVDTAPGKGCTISVTVTESREPIASHP
jgi:signal transduction histidine kinase